MCAFAPPARAQTAGDPMVRNAIAAYDAGRFEQALTLLDSVRSSLPAADGAVLSFYRGLVEFALGDAGRAHGHFARAVELDPRLVPDPSIHSPSRLRAFEIARDSMVATWRAEAERAEANGALLVAAKQWQSVLLAVPEDSVAAARLAGVHVALSNPVTPDSPEPETRPAPDSVAAPPPDPARSEAAAPPVETVAAPDSSEMAVRRLYNPQRAALLGVAFPGLGELYTGRPIRGLALMGAAVGAVAFGLTSERLDVRCLSIPVDGICPAEHVLGQETVHPFLLPSVGVAAALTIAGALDAYFFARRANERAETQSDGGPGGNARLEPPALVATSRAIRLELLRVRF